MGAKNLLRKPFEKGGGGWGGVKREMSGEGQGRVSKERRSFGCIVLRRRGRSDKSGKTGVPNHRKRKGRPELAGVETQWLIWWG